jgi:NADH:ubiquinone reductase (H+-translocating)
VHAWLMTGARARVEAFIDWGWDYFSKSRGPQVLDRTDVARIDWGDEDEDEDGDAGAGVSTAEQDAAASAAAR